MTISASTAITKAYVETVTLNYFNQPADLEMSLLFKCFLIFMFLLRILQHLFIAYYAFRTVYYFIDKKRKALHE
jgi:hypothetical protein